MMVFLDPAAPTDFTRDLNETIATGATWIRVGIPSWDAGGIFGGTFYPNTANMDFFVDVVQRCRSAGLKVVLVMADAHNDDSWTEAQFRNYNSQYWGYVAQRCGPYVDLVQVFNEHDGNDYRNHSALNAGMSFPAGYLDRMRLALLAAHTAWHQYSTAPLTTTPFGYPVEQARYDKWVAFFDGVGSSLDAICVHAYPEKNTAVINLVPTYLNNLHSRYGKPVGVLEFGLPSVSGYGTYAEVGQAIVNQIHAIMTAEPLCAILYQLRDRGTDSSDGEQVFGIITNNWSRKSYYNAVVTEISSWR